MNPQSRRIVAVLFGTRPDTIKLAPVVLALQEEKKLFRVVTIATAQHREMLDQVLEVFRIRPRYDLNIMQPRQALASLTARTLTALDEVLETVRPDMLLVQGDTTSTFVGSLAAFYRRIPVGHVEAGLRTRDKSNPFPEEINRRLTGALADLHFAPTESARRALLAESCPADRIIVTGNTVVDALNLAVRSQRRISETKLAALLRSRQRIVLITMHRRESWGEPMRSACRAIRLLSKTFPDVRFVFPVHLNPAVTEVVLPTLGGLENVHLLEPLAYMDFVQLMARSYLVLTDSGGIQEEAPALGKPVLVLRKVTERPEGVAFGTAKLVGLDEEKIVSETTELLTDRQAYRKMATAINPYGDGKASRRIVAALKKYFGLSRSPIREFRPEEQ
ncbi:MAG TPA: UDP-N-acetylglucosamine 2-epimerase (non-hydrolyzing) [Bacteroidota bacterium]|nr:UDP-N-acetylglucosamine 2-epimerase (non-hydrolyzing) [Bacteroidota bacterium]